MARISLSYPDTWLTISISVKNRDTWTEAFSGTMTEVGTTREYKYDFTETADTDYVYVATVSGYSNMSGVIYRDGGGLTSAQDSKLTQIDSRVDQTVSTLWSGILYNRNNYFDYTRLDTGFEEIKKEFIKEIQAIEKNDNKDIIKELEDIKKSIPKKDKSGEVLAISKLNDIEQKIEKQISYLEKKEEKQREIQERKQKEILDLLEEMENDISERKEIETMIDKEEIKAILKLLK